jgi:hypothetical protein
MLTAQHIDAAAEALAEIDAKRQSTIQQTRETEPVRELSPDEAWARQNLRWRDGRQLTDLANCLRVLEQHEDFASRFRYNEVIHKVLDKGTVMVDWRVTELAAAIQERFIPEIPVETVSRALVTAANRREK